MAMGSMISVVMPVYNAAAYLKRSIGSLQKQDYPRWELIAIDDGSTDKSLTILNEYASIDDRIHVLSQQNSGAGQARNAGLKHVHGDYTVFLDADDFIESNYFTLLSQRNEDVVFIDVKRIDEATERIFVEKMSSFAQFDKEDIIRYQMTGELLWGGVRKAVKTSLIKNNGILYSNHCVGEEAIYSFNVLQCAQTIGFIDTPVYTYYVHSGSLSQTLLEDPWGTVAIALKEVICDKNLYDEYADTINSFIIVAAIVSLVNMAKLYGYREYRKRAKEKLAWVKANLDKNFRIDFVHMKRKAKLLYPFYKFKLLTAFYFLGLAR